MDTIEHNDLDALERVCRGHPVVVYVCDGVYSMGGTSPINELRQLQERYGLILYVDDPHGRSLFGATEGFARSQFSRLLGGHTIAASRVKRFGSSGRILMLGTAEQEALFRRYSIPYALPFQSGGLARAGVVQESSFSKTQRVA
ncbi:7-keto-8-aminopelargonate synthetase-like enzyme [Bradyrhizobium sp. i1.7.7]